MKSEGMKKRKQIISWRSETNRKEQINDEAKTNYNGVNKPSEANEANQQATEQGAAPDRLPPVCFSEIVRFRGGKRRVSLSLCGTRKGDALLTPEMIILTLAASLLSGLVGIAVSACFFARLERRKLKVDTARRLLGSRFNIEGTEFQQAMNEVTVVFADERKVTEAMDALWIIIEKEHGPERTQKANAGLLAVLRAVCTSIGLHPKNLGDSHYLRFLVCRNQAHVEQ